MLALALALASLVKTRLNTLAFVKFCGKLDDSYPGCQRNLFSRSERTLSNSKSTVEDTRLITSQVCMSACQVAMRPLVSFCWFWLL